MKKPILPVLIVASVVNLFGMIGQATTQAAVVPDVVGWEEADAVDEMKSVDLTVICLYQNSETVDEGYVISQSREAGTTVPPFSLVFLTVSLGPEMVVVPNVVGDSETDAVSEIESAGLIVSRHTYQNSETVAVDHVISQDPAGGTSVPIVSRQQKCDVLSNCCRNR